VIGTDQITPSPGRILIFLDSTPSQGLWSKDEFGVVRPLNGGTFADVSWEPVLPDTFPSPTADITHRGRAAVGLPTAGPIPARIRFEVVGDQLADGAIFFEGLVAVSPDQTGANQVTSLNSDGGLYATPAGLPTRRIDAPGLVRKALPNNETVVVPDGSQYLAFGTFELGTGASLILEGDADLVIL
jgi:hypothetical protein